MNHTQFFEKLRSSTSGSPKLTALSLSIRRYLADEGASETEQLLADAITMKLYASKCDPAQFVPKCWQLLKCSNQFFFEYLTSDQEAKAAWDMPRISTVTEELALVVTARWIDGATRSQVESFLGSVEETATRLAAQYEQYLGLLKGRGTSIPEAISHILSLELSEIRAELAAYLLQPIISRPNGLFNTPLSYKPEANSISSERYSGFKLSLPIAPPAGTGSLPSHSFLKPNSRYNSSRASILGTPPLMRALVSNLVRSRN